MVFVSAYGCFFFKKKKKRFFTRLWLALSFCHAQFAKSQSVVRSPLLMVNRFTTRVSHAQRVIVSSLARSFDLATTFFAPTTFQFQIRSVAIAATKRSNWEQIMWSASLKRITGTKDEYVFFFFFYITFRECFCCVSCGRPLYGTYYTSDTGDVSCADCA